MMTDPITSVSVLTQKLTFDERRFAALHLRIARNCRDAAKTTPAHARALRAKMRSHALSARGRAA